MAAMLRYWLTFIGYLEAWNQHKVPAVIDQIAAKHGLSGS